MGPANAVSQRMEAAVQLFRRHGMSLMLLGTDEWLKKAIEFKPGDDWRADMDALTSGGDSCWARSANMLCAWQASLQQPPMVRPTDPLVEFLDSLTPTQWSVLSRRALYLAELAPPQFLLLRISHPGIPQDISYSDALRKYATMQVGLDLSIELGRDYRTVTATPRAPQNAGTIATTQSVMLMRRTQCPPQATTLSRVDWRQRVELRKPKRLVEVATSALASAGDLRIGPKADAVRCFGVGGSFALHEIVDVASLVLGFHLFCAPDNTLSWERADRVYGPRHSTQRINKVRYLSFAFRTVRRQYAARLAAVLDATTLAGPIRVALADCHPHLKEALRCRYFHTDRSAIQARFMQEGRGELVKGAGGVRERVRFGPKLLREIESTARRESARTFEQERISTLLIVPVYSVDVRIVPIGETTPAYVVPGITYKESDF